MSAYIVEDQTINKVVSFLLTNGVEFAWNIKKLWSLGYDLEKPFSIEKLSKDMFFLNCVAVEQRYDEKVKDSNFKFKRIFSASEIGAYKALRCWLYQCSEGNVPEHPLYKVMDELSNSIAAEIVRKLPEYNECDWG